jgi:hypothetical protein
MHENKDRGSAIRAMFRPDRVQKTALMSANSLDRETGSFVSKQRSVYGPRCVTYGLLLSPLAGLYNCSRKMTRANKNVAGVRRFQKGV